MNMMFLATLSQCVYCLQIPPDACILHAYFYAYNFMYDENMRNKVKQNT